MYLKSVLGLLLEADSLGYIVDISKAIKGKELKEKELRDDA